MTDGPNYFERPVWLFPPKVIKTDMMESVVLLLWQTRVQNCNSTTASTSDTFDILNMII